MIWDICVNEVWFVCRSEPDPGTERDDAPTAGGGDHGAEPWEGWRPGTTLLCKTNQNHNVHHNNQTHNTHHNNKNHNTHYNKNHNTHHNNKNHNTHHNKNHNTHHNKNHNKNHNTHHKQKSQCTPQQQKSQHTSQHTQWHTQSEIYLVLVFFKINTILSSFKWTEHLYRKR